MNKRKLILTGLIVIGIVGGSLAYKINNAERYFVYTGITTLGLECTNRVTGHTFTDESGRRVMATLQPTLSCKVTYITTIAN